MTPWTIAPPPPGSSVHEILQARILGWVASPFSRGSSWLRGPTWVSLQADPLLSESPESLVFIWQWSKKEASFDSKEVWLQNFPVPRTKWKDRGPWFRNYKEFQDYGSRARAKPNDGILLTKHRALWESLGFCQGGTLVQQTLLVWLWLWAHAGHWANPKSGRTPLFTANLSLNKIQLCCKLHFLNTAIPSSVKFWKVEFNFIWSSTSLSFYIKRLQF